MSHSLQNQFDAGTEMLRAGQVNEAWQLAVSLMDQHPSNPDVHFFAADAANMRGERQAAIACLDALPEALVGSARVLLRKAQLLFSDSQRAAALETVRAAAQVVDSEERQLRAVARDRRG